MHFKQIKSFVLDSKKGHALITFMNGFKKTIPVHAVDESENYLGQKYTILYSWPTGDCKTSSREDSFICYAK